MFPAICVQDKTSPELIHLLSSGFVTRVTPMGGTSGAGTT